jgi:2-phosphosulfolactate phosphatase
VRIRQVSLAQAGDHGGVVVVVDVLRAFTLAALALARGATAIRCVATVEEALAERAANPGSLAMGEVGGRRVEGFDLTNSPTDLAGFDVDGRLLVHRTTSGTQGVVAAAPRATALYAASFVCAGATARAVAATAPAEVTFVLTGVDHRDGDEDRACADYIAAVLQGADPDPQPYLARVAASDAGRMFVPDDDADFPAGDLDHATALDAVDFAMPAEVEDGHPTLRPGR